MNRKKKQQVMNLQVTDDLTVAVIPVTDHEYVMSTDEVAAGYNVSARTITKHRKTYSNELVNGKHFIAGTISSSDPHNKVYYTKRGIVRLGFFIRSQRAKLFRDWAEDLVINALDPELQELKTLVTRAANVVGGQNKLGIRLGITRTILAHVHNRPELVSLAMRARIKDACAHILAHGILPDPEVVDYLMRIEDTNIRQGLWNKLKEGGLA